MPTLSNVLTHFFPPKPSFTEKNVPDLSGKVCLVTGANTGIGKETAYTLYAKHAKVYIAARSETKAREAIRHIKQLVPDSTGSLVFLHLDLADLANVKTAAETFLSSEDKLHTLFNNAGVFVSPAQPPPVTAQGHELALGVNCVGTFLFTQLLTPALQAASASSNDAKSVRVIWLSSYTLELRAHKDYGLRTDNLDYHSPIVNTERYGLSKCGVWCLGVEYARRYGGGDNGIVSVIINPGNLTTELQRDQGFIIRLITFLVGYPAPYGASTELFAAFSPEAAAADVNKTWIAPWGRVLPLRADLPNAIKSESEGGTGGVKKFWDWNEEQVKDYF
ncbi:putative estradiol 17 beta-dehydrogenase [Xylariaceae sp. FL0255]|nr:putative estradiol 17 beta-dehydrogenase [Xylariaceae sp. FL0255]